MSLDLPLVLRKPWTLNCIASTALRAVEMIVKSESPPPFRTKAFHLSFLDQNVVRVYTQTLSIFPVSLSPANRSPSVSNVEAMADYFCCSFQTKTRPRPLSRL